MSKILVCGLVNMETTAPIDAFPIEYRPIDYKFFGVNSYPAGVGLNVSLALTSLGDEVSLCSMSGSDSAAEVIKSELVKKGISIDYILSKNKSTAQSIVLFDNNGRRYVICDLADNQDVEYDTDVFRKAISDCDIACMCNINYSAHLLSVAKEMNIPIATDVHCLCDIHDEYNSRFLKVADIVFLSNENIIAREEAFVRELASVYNIKIIVVGMGDKGALLYIPEGGEPELIPSVYTRPVINTVGAGDSLYSAFIHFYAKTRDPHLSLQRAVYFASYKIGENGAAKGFLSEEELLNLMNNQGEIYE
ncbi:MAG: carbohydrate kinase family protein [Clostridia bacterium]|nr:carbohydrate kinase family protein [Clostridia bacterium]